MLLVGAFVRVGRLRSRRGLSGIQGVRGNNGLAFGDANSVVGLSWGERLEFEPGGVGVSDLCGW